jgi:hypothetical protein
VRFHSQPFGGVDVNGGGNHRLMRHQLLEETRTSSVIGAFFEVYNTLGFGFLVSSSISVPSRASFG